MIADGVTVLAIVNLDSDSRRGDPEEGRHPGRQDHRLRPAHPRWSAPTTTSRSTTPRSAAAGPGPGRRAWPASRPNDRLPQRLPDRQQRHPVHAGRALGARQDRPTTRSSASRPSRTGTTTRPVTIFEQMYTAADGKIDGVLAANDGLGGAVISILKKNHAPAGPGHRSGRHRRGSAEHPRRHQCMTVYKAAKEEAGALAEVAIALAKGEQAADHRHRRRTTRATVTSRRSC